MAIHRGSRGFRSATVLMNEIDSTELVELPPWRLDAVVKTPTVSPSPFPFTKENRDFIDIFCYSISVLNRLIIGGIIVARLWRYHKAGVLRWSELKTKFHLTLLCTVLLS